MTKNKKRRKKIYLKLYILHIKEEQTHKTQHKSHLHHPPPHLHLHLHHLCTSGHKFKKKFNENLYIIGMIRRTERTSEKKLDNSDKK